MNAQREGLFWSYSSNPIFTRQASHGQALGRGFPEQLINARKAISTFEQMSNQVPAKSVLLDTMWLC